MSPGQSDFKACVLTLLHSTFQVSKGPTHSTHPGSGGPSSEPKLGNSSVLRTQRTFPNWESATTTGNPNSWPSQAPQPRILVPGCSALYHHLRKAGLHVSGNSGVNLALVAPPQTWLGQGSGFRRREGKNTNWKSGVLGSAWNQK